MKSKNMEKLVEDAYESGFGNEYVDEIICDEAGNYLYDLKAESGLDFDIEEEAEITQAYIKGVVESYRGELDTYFGKEDK